MFHPIILLLFYLGMRSSTLFKRAFFLLADYGLSMFVDSVFIEAHSLFGL